MNSNACHLYLSIYESEDNGDITIEERNSLLISLFEKELNSVECIDEGVKEQFEKLKKTVGNNIPKDVADKFNSISDKMNNGMNTLADKAARATVKPADKTLPKGKLYATNSDYEKYYSDVMKWKTMYKTAEVIATGAIAIGPIDTLVKAATFGAMCRSSDPVDKVVMNKIKEVSGKAARLKETVVAANIRLKKGSMPESEIDAKLREINNEGATVAREIANLEKEMAKRQTHAASA